jgi:radical SAM protein with 4Fe4S-binding SPASM domain
VTPCPYIPEVAGDLSAQTFADIWRDSALFRRLRWGDGGDGENALGGKCGTCEYRKLCGGCRARALALSGDLLAADPSCAYEPAGDVPPLERFQDVAYGDEFAPALVWADAARMRMERIPSFVRGVVMKRVEDYARRRGRREVTVELLAEVRRALPIDFSKRQPFFVSDV